MGSFNSSIKRFWWQLSLALGTLLWVPSAYTATVTFGELSERLSITPYADVLEDASGSTPLYVVRTSTQWRSPQWSALNFGLSRSAWWVRIKLQNNSAQSQKLAFDLGTTQQDLVYWYVLEPRAVAPEAAGSLGDFLDYRQRSFPTRRLAIPLTLEPDEVLEVYIKLQTRGTAFSVMDLGVSPASMFIASERLKDLLVGLFYGVSVGSAALGALLFLVIYWAPAGYFVLFVASFGIYAAAFWASDIQNFLPDSPWVHHHLMVGSGVVAYVTGNAAAMSLVQARQHLAQRTWYVMKLLIVFTLSTYVWIALDDLSMSELMSFVSGMTLLLFSSVTLFTLSLRNVPYAKPLFLIYVLMLTALFAYILQLFGGMTAYPSMVGIIQLTALLTLGVLGFYVAIEIRFQVHAQGFKKARLAMVHYVAHDLRAPQSAILSLLERTTKDELTPLVKGAIEDQVERTVQLTDAFLWLSKAESSAYRFETVFLGDLVHEAIDQAWPLVVRKSIRIECADLDDESSAITADREMMVRCIFYLIGHVVNYSTNDSCIRIAIQRRGSQVNLCIEGQVSGMSPKLVSNAFADYRRSKNSFEPSGFGLGLAFIATVIERHSSTIECYNDVERGAIFIIGFRTTTEPTT